MDNQPLYGKHDNREVTCPKTGITTRPWGQRGPTIYQKDDAWYWYPPNDDFDSPIHSFIDDRPNFGPFSTKQDAVTCRDATLHTISQPKE